MSSESLAAQENSNASNKAILYVDGMRLNRALRAGIRRVIGKQEYLNKINVFPVPDGDTGTNIVFTLNSIRRRLVKSEEEHIGKMMTQVADSAIDGARGNSGAILAQFFQGISDSTAELGKLTIESFSQALTSGANYARLAMSEPKEGTVLTVMHDFAVAIEDIVAKTKNIDFVALLEHGLEKARTSLAETPEKLEVLKKAGVVDAGAQGFVELIEGVADFIRSGSIEDLEKPLDFALDDTEAAIGDYDGDDLTFRYCTECLIKTNSDSESIDHKKLREELNAIGNSVVVAGSTRKTKVHIHTNEPADVFKLADTFGEVTGQKADDMQQQAHTAHETSQDVIIVTDSAADIPEHLIDELNIHVVPVRIHFGDKTYLDKVSLSSKEFYDELVNNPHHPKTSQPTPGDFRRQFEYLASHFKDVVYVGLTDKVSGTLQSAQLAATRVQASGKIHVINSLSATIGQGATVIKAAEMAKQGASVEEIHTRLANIIPKVNIFAYLGDLDYAVRGGRVHKSKKVMANLLRLNPILTTTLTGELVSGGKFFGSSNRPKKFVRFLKRKMATDKKYRVLVAHAEKKEEALEVMRELTHTFKNITSIEMTDIGTAVGCHGGPGTVAASFQEVE